MLPTPLHTRKITLRFVWGAPGFLIVDGRLMDLRKRGIMPIAGKLRGPGIIHDMAVRMELTYPSLEIRGIQPTMSAFPFVASRATRGEGCPDRLPEVQRLVGASLRDGWGTAVMNLLGGPRGCFHIFTLLRLLGPTAEAAVDREQGRRPNHGGAVAGSPMFARSVIMDGMKGDALQIWLRGVLSDLYYRPDANALPLEEEMEESFEATAELETEMPSMVIRAANGRTRRSGADFDSLEAWEAVPQVGNLAGLVVIKGYTAEVRKLFAGTAGLEPMQHLLFMLAPTLQQCMPSMAEELDLRPRKAEGPHPATDTCHMFRAKGPLMESPPATGQSYS
ncbi:MAG: DUF2889 domain-containing protein [Candidatus Binatia bacterium]